MLVFFVLYDIYIYDGDLIILRDGRIKLLGRDNTQALLESVNAVPSKFLQVLYDIICCFLQFPAFVLCGHTVNLTEYCSWLIFYSSWRTKAYF